MMFVGRKGVRRGGGARRTRGGAEEASVTTMSAVAAGWSTRSVEVEEEGGGGIIFQVDTQSNTDKNLKTQEPKETTGNITITTQISNVGMKERARRSRRIRKKRQ